MTPEEIAAVARRSGFSDAEIPIAVAIAMAESGGNPNNHNPRPPDDSYGLWQINMLGDMGPKRRKQFGITSNKELFDPYVNGRAAYKVYKSQGWGAWTVYTTNDPKRTYKRFLDGGIVDKAKKFLVDDPTTLLKDKAEDLNPVAGVGEAIGGFTKMFREGVISMYVIGIGLVLLILGVVILMRGGIASTAKAVASAAPQGKLAKGASKVGKVLS